MTTAMAYTALCTLVATLLLWALAPGHAYDFYILLRFATCGVSALGAYLAIKRGDAVWGLILIVLAVLFNPIKVIPLKRETWIYVDGATAIFLLLSAGFALWAAKRLKGR